MTVAASAQTVIAPPTVDEAKEKGYEALWGDYQYGYVLPNETTLVDNDDIKVVVNNGSSSKPGANVATSSLNTKLFDRAFNMGSAAGYGSYEGVYSLDAVSAGIKQPYAVFIVDAKKGGDLTIYSNRGKNKYTIYVWDTTINEGVGTYVLASSTQAGNDAKEVVNKATVGLDAGHTYWIFGSETGANINMYEMVYTPYMTEGYSISAFDASKYSTVVLPPTVDEAKEKGYEALWGDYQYGYVLPNETALVDNDDMKVVVNNGSSSKPGANVATSSLNTTVFDRSFNMGSAAGYGWFEGVYSLDAVSAGIKQPYAVFVVEAKQGGELSLFANRGKNKFTIYVWDTTINEGVGTYVLASSYQVGSEGKELISKATVGLDAGHTYWIFGSETGANTNMYALGFNNYSAPNCGYTGESGDTGIADVIVDAQPQDDTIYNILGQKVTEDYKGLVIKNGKKYIQK